MKKLDIENLIVYSLLLIGTITMFMMLFQVTLECLDNFKKL